MTDKIDRRKFLAAAGATAATVGLAGCSSGGNGDGNGGGDETPEPTDSPTPTAGGGGGGGGAADVSDEQQSRVDEFVTSDNYDGTIVDATGQDEVVVDVGAQGNGGAFAFGPPAVAISAGTTVSFQWTGEGGLHNVVSVEDSDFDFDSGDAKESGDPFEQSFDDTGVGLYQCEPHASLNMFGAVVVLE
jgi:halocyanin-like protein